MKLNQKCGSLLLAAALLLGLFPGLMPTAWAATDITDKFTDPNFRAAVYEVIGKTAPEPIYDTDVAGVAELDVGWKSIGSLAGLEYFTGLTWLNCNGNRLTSLPKLPSGLKELWCNGNQIVSLPALPSSLTSLVCSANQLTELPTLPSGLTELDCAGNWLITSLPELPSSLTLLECDVNQLTELPALPPGLTYLGCDSNWLTELPALPSGLIYLYCYGNELTSLPKLPSGLTWLGCGANQLTELPELPSGLMQLGCNGNRLTELPELPSSLTNLNCGGNQLTSLPALPSGLEELHCWDNQLTGLDLSGLSALNTIHCSNNNMVDPSDVKGFPNIWDGRRYWFYPQRDVLNPPPLTDLSFWAMAEVSSLDTRGFIPNALRNSFQMPTRRDEFAALLVNIFEYASRQGTFLSSSPFSDIADSLYKMFIGIAYNNGLVDGTSATTFSPDGLLTREQTAKLLYTMVEKIEGAELGNGTPDFTDNDKISGWAKPYVAYAQAHDLMQGSGGQFDPQGHLTREQAMLVAERLIARYGW